MVRTHKIALEAKKGGKLNINHSAIGWMIEHCADILNKCQVGKDGRTPYERLKGKKYGGTFMEFGSPVMLRVTDKPQGGLMQERWIEGIWLGSRFNTLEHLVSRRSDGVVDLDSIIGQLHAPQGVQRIEKFEVPRACVAPPTEPAVPTSGPDPSYRLQHESHVGETRLHRQLWRVQSNPEGSVANDNWPYDRLQEARGGTAGQRHGVSAPIGAGK